LVFISACDVLVTKGFRHRTSLAKPHYLIFGLEFPAKKHYANAFYLEALKDVIS